MKLGVIARPEDRGLGLQTWEVSRHLDCSVLLVDVLEARDDIDSHWDRFPDAVRAVWRGGRFARPRLVKSWLDTVDVVYTAETFYDSHLPMWAFGQDVRTVCHLNPEFWRRPAYQPTAWWSATPWRLDQVDPATEVVPMPVALDRFQPVRPHMAYCRWLHVAGRRAIYDRNGTDVLLAALPHLRQYTQVTIAVQDGDPPPTIPPLPRHVEVQLRGPVTNYWNLYDDHDALVLPRRYGGLCLPAQEAMAAGLAVVMPDTDPNPTSWPVVATAVKGYERLHMRAGDVDVAVPSIEALGRTMDELADYRVRHEAQARSRSWAEAWSWERQAPLWRDRFRKLL